MKRHYVTTAHSALLPQLKALFASMQDHCRPFELHVLTEGREVFDWAVGQGSELAPTAVEGFIRRHPEMEEHALPGPRRDGRLLAITRRWTFAQDLLAAGIGPLSVIDVDLWFFSSPDPVFEEIGDAKMAVLPHGFAPASLSAPGVTRESHLRYGEFNAGWVYFADIEPAAHFADLCREGPIDQDRAHADGTTRWGEQGSLEVVAAAHGAHVIANPAAAPGPWCANAQPFRRYPDGAVFFGRRPLVAWHFHSFIPGEMLAGAEYAVTAEQAAVLYAPYAMALGAAGAAVPG